MDEKYQLEQKIVSMLKTVYDPEIPVDIYELGLIYRIEVKEGNAVEIDMTLTAPNCPMADMLVEDIHKQVSKVKGVGEVIVEIVFDPPWDKSMMSEEALMELGML